MRLIVCCVVLGLVAAVGIPCGEVQGWPSITFRGVDSRANAFQGVDPKVVPPASPGGLAGGGLSQDEKDARRIRETECFKWCDKYNVPSFGDPVNLGCKSRCYEN